MSVKTDPQDQRLQSEAGSRSLHRADRTRNLRGWRTVKELTEELRFSSEDACRTWLRRQRIVGVRRGRVILVDGLDIDKALRRVG
jgi:hypothetical protein